MSQTKKNGYLWIFILGAFVMIVPSIIAVYTDSQNNSEWIRYYENAEEMTAEQREQFFAEAEALNNVADSDSSGNSSPNENTEEASPLIERETVNDPFTNEMLNWQKPSIISEADIFGFIEIPKIGEILPIYLGATKENLVKGVGQVSGTSLPTGGENTHSVIAGHRGYYGASYFLYIDQLVPGDHFYIHIFDRVLTYEVIGKADIEPTDTSSLGIVEGEDLVTLLSCTPYPTNRYRICIYGKRVASTDNELNKTEGAAVAENEAMPGSDILLSFGLIRYAAPSARIHKSLNVGIVLAGIFAILFCLRIIRKNNRSNDSCLR